MAAGPINPYRPLRSPFDAIRHQDENSDGTTFEYWSAREAMDLLGYARWENMENVIRKAKAACRNGGQAVTDHFRDATQTINMPKGAQRGIGDVQMSRLGMYLLAMNGDPDKPEIAAAQRYFAVQTYRAEQLLPPPRPVEPPAPPPRPRLFAAWDARFEPTFRPHLAHVRGNFPAGAFTVVTAAIAELLSIENELHRHLIATRVMDRPDISIGSRWSKYREGFGYGPHLGMAPLSLPNLLFPVEVRVYSGEERHEFDAWLGRVYLPECLFQCYEGKDEMRVYGRLTRASAADHSSRQLAGRPARLPETTRLQLAAVGGFAPATALPPASPPRRLPR